MTKENTHNAKYLWLLGNAFIVAISLGIPTLLLILIKLLDLYDLFHSFDQRFGVFKLLVITGLIIFLLWIQISNWWKNRSMQLVTEEDAPVLAAKLNDEENSFVIKKWKDISRKGKFIRGGIILIIIGGAIYMDYLRDEDNRLFASEGNETTAFVISTKQKYSRKQVKLTATYQYYVDGKPFQGEKVLQSGWFLMSAEINGFPIEEGDEYQLKYLASDPDKNRLDINSPAGTTKNRYIELTSNSLLSTYSDSTYCQCVAKQTFEQFGTDGIARLYHRNTSFWDNERYNSTKYNQLIKKDAFKTIEKNCKR